MKYCVLVKISKQQLGFWHQLEGGVHTPLSINGPNTIPLCFYVNGNEFKIGDFAKERFLVNDRHAYNDYFEIVKDPVKHFTLHGDSKPVKQLLYYGVENYLSHFIKTILYKNESIEAFRTNFCLRFWFDDDIVNQEKVLVENLFKEAGYENVAEVDVNLFLNKELNSEIKSTKSRLCLSAVSNDLYVKLFKAPAYGLLGQIQLEQLGSDPRAKILAKLILEDIKEASPHIYIEEEKEIAFIINHCVQLLSSLSPIMRNDIELSTGVRTDYKIRLAQLEERLMYNRGIEDKVIPQLENILSANGIVGSSVDIILNGDKLNTNYFKDKLTKKFPNVYGVSSLIQEKLLKSIFSTFASEGYRLSLKVSSAAPSGVLKGAENLAPVVNTPPKINIPPVVKTPPLPAKQVNGNLDNKQILKPEIISPPIIKPEFKLPPVNKDVKKVEVPPLPPRAKVPPPPPPPPPIKKKNLCQ
jgi:hypothetical protein